LFLSTFRDLDTSGHLYGWLSEEQKQSATELDSNLDVLISDLRQEFFDYERYYIITADHGGEGTSHSSGCDACRRVPIIVVSENTDEKYTLNDTSLDVYDTACVVLNIMDISDVGELDCEL